MCHSRGPHPRPSPAQVGAKKEVSRWQDCAPERVLVCGPGQPWARCRSQCSLGERGRPCAVGVSPSRPCPCSSPVLGA